MEENALLKELSRAVFLGIERGEFWGRKGAIALGLRRYKLLVKSGDEIKALGAIAGLFLNAYHASLLRAATNNLFLQIFWRTRAKWYFFRASYNWRTLELRKGAKLSPNILYIGMRIAYIEKDFKKSLEIGWSALKAKNIANDSRALIAKGIAEDYFALGNIAKARSYFAHAFQNFSSLRSASVKVRLLMSRGKFYGNQGDIASALRDLGFAGDLSREHNLKVLIREIEPLWEETVRRTRE